MFLNNETDYAIRIVSCLADREERIDAATVAEQTGVTPRFTLKILHRLVQGGIVRSLRGNKGGYVLARPAGERMMFVGARRRSRDARAQVLISMPCGHGMQ